jgi:hypothetical protein
MDIKSYVDSWQLRDKKDVHPSHRTAVVEVNDIVLDLKSMLEADTYSELHQAVSDLINELEEDKVDH